jgi:sodium transport system permease protein
MKRDFPALANACASGVWRTTWIVLCKEIVDALRDKRTLMTVLLSSAMIGPLMLFALSNIISAGEAKAERREMYVQGAEHGPTFTNFLKRQGITAKAPPANYEEQLRSGALNDAVLVIGEHFEEELIRGEHPQLEVVYDSSSREAASGAGAHVLFNAFIRERASLTLALRGVAPEVMTPVTIAERDLVNKQARTTRFAGMVPLFVLMAVMIGALSAALDSTAGERERGSLEPLLMTPSQRIALVLGKWGAVTALGILVSTLCCLSFLPAQALIRSESLQAMFQFGWKETALFILFLSPFAAAISAMMMTVAFYAKTVKEAQAQCSLLLTFVNLFPLIIIMNPGAEPDWFFAVPGLAQNLQLTHILKGETLTALQILLPCAVAILLTAGGIWNVARRLQTAAVR